MENKIIENEFNEILNNIVIESDIFDENIPVYILKYKQDKIATLYVKDFKEAFMCKVDYANSIFNGLKINTTLEEDIEKQSQLTVESRNREKEFLKQLDEYIIEPCFEANSFEMLFGIRKKKHKIERETASEFIKRPADVVGIFNNEKDAAIFRLGVINRKVNL